MVNKVRNELGDFNKLFESQNAYKSSYAEKSQRTNQDKDQAEERKSYNQDKDRRNQGKFDDQDKDRTHGTEPKNQDIDQADKNNECQAYRILLDENGSPKEIQPIPQLSETPSEQEIKEYVCNFFNIKPHPNRTKKMRYMDMEPEEDSSPAHHAQIPKESSLAKYNPHRGKFNKDLFIINFIEKEQLFLKAKETYDQTPPFYASKELETSEIIPQEDDETPDKLRKKLKTSEYNPAKHDLMKDPSENLEIENTINEFLDMWKGRKRSEVDQKSLLECMHKTRDLMVQRGLFDEEESSYRKEFPKNPEVIKAITKFLEMQEARNRSKIDQKSLLDCMHKTRSILIKNGIWDENDNLID